MTQPILRDPGVDRQRARPRYPAYGLVAVVIALLAVVAAPFAAASARADGGQSSEEGYVMVLQALSYLVNDTGPNGTAQAIAMVDDALAAEDQDGVDVAVLQDAKVALQEGRVDAGKALLEESITEALASLEPAVGEESGTTEVLPPLPPKTALSGLDWFFLVLSVVAAAVGVFLAVLFRPTESLRELSQDIADAKAAHRDGVHATRGEAS